VEDGLRVCFFSVTYARSRDGSSNKAHREQSRAARAAAAAAAARIIRRRRRRRRRRWKYGSSANVVVVVVMHGAWSFDKEVRNELDNTHGAR
jgi:hypothetical protein